MFPKYMIYLLSSTFLLTACGLETDEEEAVERNLDGVENQYSFLPLSSGSQWVYKEGSTEYTTSIAKNTTLTDGDKVVYDLAMQGGTSPLTLNLQSTTDGITLEGLTGPIEIPLSEGNLTVNSVVFGNPIDLTASDKVRKDTSQATIKMNGATEGLTLTVTYTSAGRSQLLETDLGDFPGWLISLDASMTVINNSSPVEVGIQIELGLSEGTGIVTQDIAVIDPDDVKTTVYSGQLSGLIGLPHPIWFDNANGEPSAVGGTEFLTNLGQIKSTEYDILNQSNIDELDWLTIEPNTAKSYTVSMSSSNDLPSKATAVQVIFVNKEDESKQLSGTVILNDFFIP